MTEGAPELAATVAASPHAIHAVPSTTITSSADARMREELLRTQRLALTGMAGPVVSLTVLPWLGGDDTARIVLYVSLALFVIGNAGLYYLARDPRRWTRARVGSAWLLTTVAVLGIVYFFGLYSGALMTVLIGVYVIALGRDPWLAAVVYATSAIGHAALCALAIGGVIEDRGLLSSEGIATGVLIASTALLQAILFAAYQLARSSQRTSREAVDELERAVRAIAMREAMLQEVRDDLERAARAGGGRYTDQVLGSLPHRSAAVRRRVVASDPVPGRARSGAARRVARAGVERRRRGARARAGQAPGRSAGDRDRARRRARRGRRDRDVKLRDPYIAPRLHAA